MRISPRATRNDNGFDFSVAENRGLVVVVLWESCGMSATGWRFPAVEPVAPLDENVFVIVTPFAGEEVPSRDDVPCGMS